MILQLLEPQTLAGNRIFKMASDCHYPLLFFHIMINMHSTEMKFSIDLLNKISNMSFSFKICNITRTKIFKMASYNHFELYCKPYS